MGCPPPPGEARVDDAQPAERSEARRVSEGRPAGPVRLEQCTQNDKDTLQPHCNTTMFNK